MVPISLTLEGFLSYKEKREFDFSDRRLWMLSGDNGAGKSAVFDAITFALYGQHRLGSQNADELINRNANQATVHFIFQVDGYRFRAQRTVQRNGNPITRLLEMEVGGQWEPLPESNRDAKFEAHIRRILGLDYKGFTASVFLGQGDSDRLIEASPTERFNHLKQIVDLSEYELLEKRAGKRRDFCAIKVKALNEDLRKTSPVSSEEMDEAEKRWDKAQHAVKDGKATVEGAIIALADAKRFNDLNRELTAIGIEIAAAEILVGDEVQIRTDAIRKVLLDRVWPLLHRILEATKSLQNADAKVQTAQTALETRVRRLSESLRLPPDAATVAVALDGRIRDLTAQKEALPYLEAFAGRRDDAQGALTYWRKAIARVAESPIPSVWEVYAQTEIADEGAAHKNFDTAQAQSSEAVGRLQAAEEQLARFREAGTDATCRYCGQPMTEEQRVRQEAELKGIVETLQDECAQQAERVKAAKEIWKRAQAALDTTRREHNRLIKVATEAIEAEKQAQHSWNSAWNALSTALIKIPAPFRKHVTLPAVADQATVNDLWFAPDAYPTAHFLHEMRVAIQTLPSWESERAGWDKEKQTWETAVEVYTICKREWESANAALSEEDHATFRSEISDHATFDALTAEREKLKDAGERLKELEIALAKLANLRARRDALTAEIEKIPEVHRVTITVAEAQLEAARVALKAAETELQAAETLLNELKDRQKRRLALEDERRRYVTLQDQYSVLAELLGREKLQRELLRVVEGRILEHSNAILNRFSGGHLRLAPRPDDGSRGAGTALDFICHNYDTGSESLLLKLLSGSQKFRVSVALALGIGQFLSGDEARRRSVIIDEGFGSLDPNGLRDMAQEIKNLGEILDRIIVVSHQSEFAESFPDRYHIRLVDGSSCPERHCTL